LPSYSLSSSVAAIDAAWRERCRADEITSRGEDPVDSGLPGALVDHLSTGGTLEQVEHAAALLVTPGVTGSEVMRQLSLLGDVVGRCCKTRNAALELHRSTSRSAEFISAALLSRTEAEARIDVLTGLAGRRAYDADLDGALQRVRIAGSVVLTLMDVNGLRIVNNEIDHVAGDTYLKYFAALLSEAIADIDARAYHVSGDEFYALFRDVARVTADGMIQRLIDAEHCPPVSFGSAEAPAEGDDPDALALLAEQRMKAMKFSASEDERFATTRRWLQSEHWEAAYAG
jgi:diguanylate cyclase (GGDEF)-like protein